MQTHCQVLRMQCLAEGVPAPTHMEETVDKQLSQQNDQGIQHATKETAQDAILERRTL